MELVYTVSIADDEHDAAMVVRAFRDHMAALQFVIDCKAHDLLYIEYPENDEIEGVVLDWIDKAEAWRQAHPLKERVIGPPQWYVVDHLEVW